MVSSVLTTAFLVCIWQLPPLARSTCQSTGISLTAQTSEGVIEETGTSLDCQWIISSPDNVEVNVTEWTLVNDEHCSVDCLSIYDGNSESDLLLAKLCGRGSSKIMISSGQHVFVRLITTGSSDRSGFRLTYRSYGSELPRCYPTNEWLTRRYLRATTESQFITSQNYPSDYPVSTREEWVIIKPSASASIAIILVDSEIESSRYCGYDYLAIYNGKCSTDKQKAKICGTETNSWTLSGSDYVLIRFHSDSGKTGKGFKLKYYLGKVEDPESDRSALHAVLIGLIVICVLIIFMLVAAKLYMKCIKKPKVRPNQTQLQNRRTVLESQVRRGPFGSRLARMMTAQSIHAEMTRYLGSTTEHDSRVSTFEISSSQCSGTGLVYEDGMYQPPSYSTLFRHYEDTPITAPPMESELAPPPYPGSPEIKPGTEVEGSSDSLPCDLKNEESNEENSLPPPSYSISS